MGKPKAKALTPKLGWLSRGYLCPGEEDRRAWAGGSPSRQENPGHSTRDRDLGTAIQTGIRHLEFRQPLECRVLFYQKHRPLGIIIAATVIDPCGVVHVVCARLDTKGFACMISFSLHNSGGGFCY